MSIPDHVAVSHLGKGVSSVELADLIGQIAERTRRRVITVGESEYGGKIQKFETMNPEVIYEELLDEIADAYAYLAFAAIHAMALRNKSRGIRGDDQ